MILDEIVMAARKRMETSLEKKEALKEKAFQMAEMEQSSFSFEERLRRRGMNVICEVKKASPSKGLIAEEFPYLEIAKEYEEAGAAAISVLTEPEFFKGDLRYLEEIAGMVQIPVLRKDFILEEYQIYETKVSGASAVLLISTVLGEEELVEYIRICDKLHLSALVEVHDEREVTRAVGAGARVIGINNRNLQDFSVDIDNSMRLKNRIPDGVLAVAESGIKNREQIRKLEEARFDGVLIGETLMRAVDKKGLFLKLLND